MLNGIVLIGLMGITILLNTLAQTALKLGTAQTTPINLYTGAGLLLYGGSAVLYIIVLGRLNLSFIYPIMIGLTMVATVFSGVLVLHEKVATGQWVGIGLMLSGLATIALNQASAAPKL